MKIALCHQNILPARGGAEMYVADLARRLVAQRHDVHLFTTRWDATALPSSSVIHQMARPRGPRFLRPWRFSEAVMAALRNDPPDVSIGFDKVLGTDIYYPLGGLHAATAEHNLLKHKEGLTRSIAKMIQSLDTAHNSFAKLERQLMSGPNRPVFVANSDLVRQHVLRYYGIGPQNIPVVHNAIDPNRFDETDRASIRIQMRNAWSFGTQDVVAALVAMNYRLKGLEPLLHALARIPANIPLKLLVAGSRVIKPWQRLADKLGIRERVRFIGRSADVRQVFFAADLLVHPTFYDPCSLVVLEALACGLPVITSAHNGAGERMAPPREGYVVADPNDHQDLADSLIRLTDADQRVKCGQAARLAARRWTMDDHVQAIELVCRQVAERKRRAAA